MLPSPRSAHAIAGAFRCALEQDQNTPDGYVVVAVVPLHQQRVDDAEKSAREAPTRNLQCANAYVILAHVHGECKEYSDEVKDLERIWRFALITEGGIRARASRHQPNA